MVTTISTPATILITFASLLALFNIVVVNQYLPDLSGQVSSVRSVLNATAVKLTLPNATLGGLVDSFNKTAWRDAVPLNLTLPRGWMPPDGIPRMSLPAWDVRQVVVKAATLLGAIMAGLDRVRQAIMLCVRFFAAVIVLVAVLYVALVCEFRHRERQRVHDVEECVEVGRDVAVPTRYMETQRRINTLIEDLRANWNPNFTGNLRDVFPFLHTLEHERLEPALESRLCRAAALELRMALNFPTKEPTAAMLMAAYSKLATLFSMKTPDQRMRNVDYARYATRIVALAFVPSDYEVQSAQVLHSHAARTARHETRSPRILGTPIWQVWNWWPFYHWFGSRASAGTADF